LKSKFALLLALFALTTHAQWAPTPISALPNQQITLSGTELFPLEQSNGSSGTASSSGIAYYVLAQLSSTQIINLWTGTCSSTTFLNGAGACTTAGSGTGVGNVVTTGSPSNGNLASFSGAASVTNGNLSGDCTTSGTLAITCLKTNGVAFGSLATQNAPIYPQTSAESAASITPSNYTYVPPGIESGSLLRYGGTAPALPNAVFFDGSISQNLIGNSGLYATNLWFSNGTSSSRLQEFSSAFEYIASGGGAYNNNADFGVALYAASKLTGGSRSIYGVNTVVEVDIARQAAAIGMETDINNNSGANVTLTTNAYDQMFGIRAASGGSYSPQVGFQSWAATAASRWRLGAGLANWSDYGLVIVQDPGTVTTDASGTNTGTLGSAVTGPAIFLQPSSNGSNPLIQLRNAGNTADAFDLYQNGQVITSTGFTSSVQAATASNALVVAQGSQDSWLVVEPASSSHLQFQDTTASAIVLDLSSGGVQVGAPTGGAKGAGTLNTQSVYIQGVALNAALSGTTGSVGGSSLANGTCSTGTVSITGSTTSMAVVTTPATFPGAGFHWAGYVSTAGTVTVEVCNATGATNTPTASTYNVRVLQ
jgi:hypothetical protein